MNKIILIAVSLLLLTACAQDDVFFYQYENESIQFDGDEDQLTKSFNFFNSDLDTDTLFLTLALIGKPAEYDRKFFLKVEVEEGNEEALNLIKIENPYIFKANKLSQRVGIEIGKTFGLGDNFLAKVVIDAAHEESDFEEGIIEQQKFIVNIMNKIQKPSTWDQFRGMYGSYSDEKYEFMIEVCGNVDFFNWDTVYDYMFVLWDALDEYNATHDPDKPFNFFS